MYTTIPFHKVLLLLLCSLLVFPALAEEPETVSPPKNALEVSAGIGWGYYFNNFKMVPSDAIQNNKEAFSLKIMWAPEYRLKLGLQIGYYPYYTTNAILDPETGIRTDNIKASLKTIPFFVVASMRVVDNFYLSVGAGLVIMDYVVDGLGSKNSGTQVSLSNFMAAVGYHYPINKDFSVGVEANYSRLGKNEDDHLTIQVMVSYKLFRW